MISVETTLYKALKEILSKNVSDMNMEEINFVRNYETEVMEWFSYNTKAMIILEKGVK